MNKDEIRILYSNDEASIRKMVQSVIEEQKTLNYKIDTICHELESVLRGHTNITNTEADEIENKIHLATTRFYTDLEVITE